jgi:hypothetical protein
VINPKYSIYFGDLFGELDCDTCDCKVSDYEGSVDIESINRDIMMHDLICEGEYVDQSQAGQDTTT